MAITPIEYICIHCGDNYASHSVERFVCLKLQAEGRRHGFTNYTGEYFEGQRDTINPFKPGPVSDYLKFKYPDWQARLANFQQQLPD